MPTHSFELIFHGTGCSSGLPNITCLTSKPVTCETCELATHPSGWKNKRRNTGAITRIRSAAGSERIIVIDVGKTFLAAALDLFPRYDLRRIDAVLLTHGHADAINGLDDLRSWTLGDLRIQDHIDVYLSEATMNDVKRGFPYLVSKEFATGSGHIPQFKWHIIEGYKPLRLDGLDFDIIPVDVYHGNLPTPRHTTRPDFGAVQAPDPYLCFGFIFGTLMVYMSDVSGIPDQTWDTIDTLGGSGPHPYHIFAVDCLRLNRLVAHFGVKDAIDAAIRLNAYKTCLFGFGHENPHDIWDLIARYVGGQELGPVRPSAQKALDCVSEMGVQRKLGLRVGPVYDGKCLRVIDGTTRHANRQVAVNAETTCQNHTRHLPHACRRRKAEYKKPRQTPRQPGHRFAVEMNLPPGTEGIRLRKPTNTTERPLAAKKPRHTGLLQDQLRRTSRAPWCPTLSTAFRMLVLIRVAAATWSNIQDCDEVFNFWEPLHYLDQGHGFQTWETSPTYALRSWAYILVHIFPAKFPIWIASFGKRHTFFGLRMIFAFVSSFCEARLFRAVAEHVNDRVGRYMLFMLMFNAGMWNASTAFLPSTFAMYAATAAASFSFVPPSSSRVQRTFAATLLFASGAIIGWPFSLLLAVPFVIEELTVYGGDIVPSSSLPKWVENRWKYLFGSGAVAASIFVPVIVIDTYAYGRLTLTPWNIIRYNIFSSSSGRSPNLYGTEPWYYYISNLILNFNILAPLALGSLPALLVTKRFDSKRLGVSRGPVDQTSSPYTLLAIRLAPFYLWFITLSLQAHKEERFLYPVYPLVCFNAAVTLYLARGWMETAYINATNSPYRAANTSIFRLATLFTIIITSLLSISRIAALFKYYHAPLDVAFHFQYEELPRLLNTTGLLPVPDLTTKKHTSKYDEDAPVDLSLVRQFGLRICWGAEWYRFPGSYLVPSGVEPLLVESGFDGMLPRPFPAVVPITDPSPVSKSSFKPVKVPLKPSSGLFGELSRTLGRTTRLTPSGFNDLNRAEEGQAADPAECDYFVHLRLPHNPERQEPVPPVGLWEDVVCFSFLDAQRSSVLSRVFWVPGSIWQKGNTFGEYCLLREKERAQIRERETKWSKTA
ncbi:unnamed protein product [Rhizoctonia solani]|nr:unnamed protein product [Rhizoctonia solani]